MFNIAIPIIPIGFIADTFYNDRFCSDRFHTDTFHTDMFCLCTAFPLLCVNVFFAELVSCGYKHIYPLYIIPVQYSNYSTWFINILFAKEVEHRATTKLGSTRSLLCGLQI